MTPHNPILTVAIVSERYSIINRCIDSIKKQSLDKTLYEILIISGYKKDAVLDNSVHIFENAPKSISQKRNIAIKLAQGSIIAYTDDDCIAHKDWLKYGLEYLNSHPTDIGVQGKIIIPDTDKDTPNYNQTKRLGKPLYQTSNIFYRIDAIKNVGGFDKRFMFQREDADLGFTLEERKMNIGYEEKAIVYHPVRKNEYFDLIKTAYRKRYDPLLKRKHPKLFKKYFRHILPGSFSLMIFLWLFTFAILFISQLNLLIKLTPVLIGCLLLTTRRHIGYNFSFKWILASFTSYLIAPLIALFVIFIGFFRWRTNNKQINMKANK